MFKMLSNKNIEKSLHGNTRQYLAGQLKLPQILDHIDDPNIEIGITDYDEYFIEQPHWHKVAYEYQYVLSGETKYLDLSTGGEYYYKQGDFFRIEPHTTYAQKSVAGTRILFIKTPPGNDKVSEDADETTKRWLTEWE